jgi:polyisoprenoid-binding protein YceI
MTNTTQTAVKTWAIDSVHSNVEFSVKHMMISTVKGQFSELEGAINFDQNDPGSSYVEASIDTASITTFNEQRDQHLRTNDFFNAEEHRTITFKSNQVETVNENRFEVHGDLTIRDVTKPVVLDTEYEGHIVDAFGQNRVSFTATTEISRSEFGVNWNAALETGGVVVGDKVKITLYIAAVLQD